jgi:hypothetical protein
MRHQHHVEGSDAGSRISFGVVAMLQRLQQSNQHGAAFSDDRARRLSGVVPIRAPASS